MAGGIIWDEAALYALLEGPSGSVARDLTRRAIRVHARAVTLCPVGTPESTGVPGYVGGTLRSSLTWELVVESGLCVKVGTNTYYAGYVELGTRYMRAQPYLRPALSEAR